MYFSGNLAFKSYTKVSLSLSFVNSPKNAVIINLNYYSGLKNLSYSLIYDINLLSFTSFPLASTPVAIVYSISPTVPSY